MPSPRKRRRLAGFLVVLFALAVIMGPGPGIHLVNPDPDETTVWTFLGMPVVYAWTAFWFGIQALVVLCAYRFLWKGAGS